MDHATSCELAQFNSDLKEVIKGSLMCYYNYGIAVKVKALKVLVQSSLGWNSAGNVCRKKIPRDNFSKKSSN